MPPSVVIRVVLECCMSHIGSMISRRLQGLRPPSPMLGRFLVGREKIWMRVRLGDRTSLPLLFSRYRAEGEPEVLRGPQAKAERWLGFVLLWSFFNGIFRGKFCLGAYQGTQEHVLLIFVPTSATCAGNVLKQNVEREISMELQG